MITIITGRRNAGKTAYMKQIMKDKESIYGYISEKIIEDNEVVGYQVKNIRTGEEQVLVHQTKSFEKQFVNKRFHFDLQVFEKCCTEILIASQHCEHLFIDEIGKLELTHGLGFYQALQQLIEKDIHLYVTVRDSFLPELVALLKAHHKRYEIIPIKSVGAIIMASGASTRFQEGNKLLYPYKGQSLFQWTLNNVIASHTFAEVVVVSRYEAIKEICEAYKEVIYIHNEEAAQGISSSIKRGTAYMKGKVDGYMYIQADQIGIRPTTLSQLVQAFRDYDAEVVSPKFGEKMGSPKIISVTQTEQLLMLTGDEGGKTIVQGCKNRIDIFIDDEQELVDIDTMEDLQQIRE